MIFFCSDKLVISQHTFQQTRVRVVPACTLVTGQNLSHVVKYDWRPWLLLKAFLCLDVAFVCWSSNWRRWNVQKYYQSLKIDEYLRL